MKKAIPLLSDGTNAAWSAYGYTGTDKPWVQYEFACRVALRAVSSGGILTVSNPGTG